MGGRDGEEERMDGGKGEGKSFKEKKWPQLLQESSSTRVAEEGQ